MAIVLVLVFVGALWVFDPFGGTAGPEPPESLRQAATDSQWAATQLAQLSARAEGDKTRGLFFRPGKATRPLLVISGRGDGPEQDPRYYESARQLLIDSGEFDANTAANAAAHVEVKAAAYMRLNSLSYAVIVINHASGPCGNEDGTGAGCTRAAPIVMPEGYRLMVWWPAQPEPRRQPLDGRGDA